MSQFPPNHPQYPIPSQANLQQSQPVGQQVPQVQPPLPQAIQPNFPPQFSQQQFQQILQNPQLYGQLQASQHIYNKQMMPSMNYQKFQNQPPPPKPRQRKRPPQKVPPLPQQLPHPFPISSVPQPIPHADPQQLLFHDLNSLSIDQFNLTLRYFEVEPLDSRERSIDSFFTRFTHIIPHPEILFSKIHQIIHQLPSPTIPRIFRQIKGINPLFRFVPFHNQNTINLSISSSDYPKDCQIIGQVVSFPECKSKLIDPSGENRILNCDFGEKESFSAFLSKLARLTSLKVNFISQTEQVQSPDLSWLIIHFVEMKSFEEIRRDFLLERKIRNHPPCTLR